MKQSSSIRRASQQARNAMRELDRAGIEELTALYEQAADEIRARIRNASDAGDRITTARLRPLMAQVEAVLDELGQKRDQLLQQQLQDAAQLGTRPFTAQGVLAVGGSQEALSTSAAMRINEAAVQFVNEVKQADGLNLSERLWRLNQGAKEVLGRAIASAIIRGDSAARSAMDLAMNGQAVPFELQQLARGSTADQVAKLADLLASGDGSELWKAERVFRTEINRAHGEAYMAGAVQTSGFAGFRFLLSPAHPRPDICDLLAAQNLHGLGAGVYPTRELTPWPAHPNTLSFLVMVFESEISDADRAGRETPLQALQRLAPEIREGVLGKTKAQYFDQGVLTRGMIRAPVEAVTRRIESQAARSSQPHPLALHNWQFALIPEGKLAAYALKADHRGAGADKTRVFAGALGMTAQDAPRLESMILEALPRFPAVKGKEDKFGLRFHVDLTLQGPKGPKVVRTAWIFPVGSDQPRLVTIFLR